MENKNTTDFNSNKMSALPYFKEFYINFQKEPLNKDIIQVPINNNKPFYFGLINIHTIQKKTDIIQDFVFIIDISGSMLELEKENSKITQLKNTLLNILEHFNNNLNIYITLITFHSEVSTLVERINITSENKTEIMEKINKIEPNGLTNIGKVLTYTNLIINEYNCYQTKKTMIFMTDGVATTGEIRPNLLIKLVNPNIKNIFIGFGEEHDGDLLETFTSIPDTFYYFINKTEKCGIVYGEIIYDIMHILFEKCFISLENGFIYDYKKNSWTTKLYIGDLIGDTNKHYHIISNEIEYCNVYLHTGLSKDIFQIHKIYNDNLIFDNYIYRHRVLEILYQVSEYQKTKNNNMYKNILKSKLKSLQNEILQYIQENDKNELLQRLYNDLEISYHTIDKYSTRFYTSARFISQGEERSSNVDYNTITENIFNASPAKINVMHQISLTPMNYFIEITPTGEYDIDEDV